MNPIKGILYARRYRPDERGVWYAKKFMQKNYDPEIDEGWGERVRLFAVRATDLAWDQRDKLIKKIGERVRDYNVCKSVQVVGFNRGGESYISVGCEVHMVWAVAARDQLLKFLDLKGYEVLTKEEEFIPLPL